MPATHAHNLNHAVAAQFASRPTFRQVAGEQIMKVILEHYPLVGVHRPEMTSAAPLYGVDLAFIAGLRPGSPPPR